MYANIVGFYNNNHRPDMTALFLERNEENVLHTDFGHSRTYLVCLQVVIALLCTTQSIGFGSLCLAPMSFLSVIAFFALILIKEYCGISNRLNKLC